MKKENQSLIDFLQLAPQLTFIVQRSPISNKEAQVLFDVWKQSETDEYGKYIVSSDIDPMQIVSLTSKGYVRNTPTRIEGSTRLLEFTDKGKEVLKKIILHQEKSAFEKESSKINYAAICHAADRDRINARGKVASTATASIRKNKNWFERLL